MSADRRYSEREIAKIFKQAAQAQEAAQQKMSRSEGLTLAELQHIGSEAGITPEFIAQAAAAVDGTVSTPPPTTYLGVPITVSHAVDLPRTLSDDDWDQLVVDLRETFQASGQISRDGQLWQWRNGNLRALLEPTAAGHRLRLRTLNGNQRSALMGGLAFFVMGLAFMAILGISGKFGLNPDTLLMAMLSAAGLATMGIASYRLPRWAKRRKQQMEAIAARATDRAAPRSSYAEPEQEFQPQLDLDADADLPAEERVGITRRSRS